METSPAPTIVWWRGGGHSTSTNSCRGEAYEKLHIGWVLTHWLFCIIYNTFTLSILGSLHCEANVPLVVQSLAWSRPLETMDYFLSHGCYQVHISPTIMHLKIIIHEIFIFHCYCHQIKFQEHIKFYLYSLQMYRRSKTYLSRKQRIELSRRTLALLLYILRSPFYEQYSKSRLNNLLQFLSEKLPLARLICQPLQRYIPEWQAIYFYMWSS